MGIASRTTCAGWRLFPTDLVSASFAAVGRPWAKHVGSPAWKRCSAAPFLQRKVEAPGASQAGCGFVHWRRLVECGPLGQSHPTGIAAGLFLSSPAVEKHHSDIQPDQLIQGFQQ